MDNILSEPSNHSHAPNTNRVPVIELQNHIKARAAASDEASSGILYSALRTFPLDSAGALPKNDTLMRAIRRQRVAAPLNANNRLPDNLKQTDRGDNFVLHEDDDLIIFTTDANLSVLKTCKHWFADGTFKVRNERLIFPQFCNSDCRCVLMISTNCLHCMDYSHLKLFHWCMVFL
jgi:hypothetical protein